MEHVSIRTLGIAGLVLLLGSGPGWAQGAPPLTTLSNTSYATTGGGSGALQQDTSGIGNTAFGDSA
ncbi:MAG: hypothetical protein JO267_15920, partial [Alphaproteobacteria bacterium]|nr:hypothetical protein [Alphaproteobacteria bacterium]